MLRLSVQEEMQMNCTEMGEGEVLERGRLYERYREKREAKLREEWFLRMEAKEAEMRAMWDLFERSAKHTSAHQESDSQRLSGVPLHSCATRELKKSVVEEEKKSKVSAPRNNSTKRISDVDRTTFSMPLTFKEYKAPLIIPQDRPNTSSSMSSQRSLSRSRTITNEQKKCKTVKYHHRRNTLAGPAEFRGLDLDNNFYQDSSSAPGKSHVGKSFLRKGSGIGPGAGAAVAKQRSSTTGSVQRDTDITLQSGHLALALSQELLTEILVSGSTSGDSYSNEELKESQMSVVRERKKWGTPEKAVLFSGEPQKAGTKGLKKLLLNIVGKSKHRESAVICA